MPGRAEAAAARAPSTAARPASLPAYSRDRSDNELGDPHAALDAKGFFAEIDENHRDLAAIIGIDGAGAVQHGDAMPRGETGAWPDLGLEALRKGDGDAGRHLRAPSRRQRQRLGHRRQQVEAGGVRAGVGRQRQIQGVRQVVAAARI